MTTPTKAEILDKAEELFYNDTGKYITPEEDELKESGYYDQARIELMQGENSEALSYAEQLANELGFRLIPEKQHSDIIYYQLKYEKLRNKVKILQQQPEPQQPEITQKLEEKQITIQQSEETVTFVEINKTSIYAIIKHKAENFVAILKLVKEICVLKFEN